MIWVKTVKGGGSVVEYDENTTVNEFMTSVFNAFSIHESDKDGCILICSDKSIVYNDTEYHKIKDNNFFEHGETMYPGGLGNAPCITLITPKKEKSVQGSGIDTSIDTSIDTGIDADNVETLKAKNAELEKKNAELREENSVLQKFIDRLCDFLGSIKQYLPHTAQLQVEEFINENSKSKGQQK